MKVMYKWIALVIGLILPLATSAHTDFNSHPGVLANIIALGIVLISIIGFLIIDKRRKNKKSKSRR